MGYHAPRTISTTTTTSTFEPINEFWTDAPTTSHSTSHSSSSNSWNEDKIVNQPITVHDYSGMINSGTTIIKLMNLQSTNPFEKDYKPKYALLLI